MSFLMSWYSQMSTSVGRLGTVHSLTSRSVTQCDRYKWLKIWSISWQRRYYSVMYLSTICGAFISQNEIILFMKPPKVGFSWRESFFSDGSGASKKLKSLSKTSSLPDYISYSSKRWHTKMPICSEVKHSQASWGSWKHLYASSSNPGSTIKKSIIFKT